MVTVRSIVLILLFISSGISFAQGDHNTFSVLFYNVENLFDTYDDTLTEDDEFTPHGIRNWTYDRFMHKLNRLFKVLAVSGGWDPPDIIALAETEHKWIVDKLASDTPLSKYQYRVVHRESPDRRGIDISILYREGSFAMLSDSAITIRLKEDPPEFTRDIIHLTGIIPGNDTVHLLFNHWPSRYLGQVNSEWKRTRAARILRDKVTEILADGQGSGIIISGDFNDEPDNNSLSLHLGAGIRLNDTVDQQLYNLSPLSGQSIKGTHKFQGRWYMFDQYIVSGKLLASTISCRVKILDFDFLFEKDESYMGVKPFRTYYGYSYTGGFSDHLPVLLELTFRHPEP
jgi:endonuclease/exonuclease/phosphatase family metal-dependent hydrolase